MRPITEAMLTIRPDRCLRRLRQKALVKRNVPLRLMSSTASQSASLIRMSKPSLVMPALLTRMSTLPVAVENLLRRGLHAGGVGDVGGERPGLAAQRLGLLHRLGAELQLQIHAGNVRACGGEFQGNGLADAAAGARHHRYLIC